MLILQLGFTEGHAAPRGRRKLVGRRLSRESEEGGEEDRIAQARVGQRGGRSDQSGLLREVAAEFIGVSFVVEGIESQDGLSLVVLAQRVGDPWRP
jgi:hypothetical protein